MEEAKAQRFGGKVRKKEHQEDLAVGVVHLSVWPYICL
jgi:hypothetical protein